jgi:small subunit ribosomal protein S10
VKTADSKTTQKIRIKLRSFDHKVIDQCVQMIIVAAQNTGALVVGPIPLPTKIEKVTVNRSTFVHKNARDQFEIRTHNRLLDIEQSNAKTVEALTSLSLPAGVNIEIKMI